MIFAIDFRKFRCGNIHDSFAHTATIAHSDVIRFFSERSAAFAHNVVFNMAAQPRARLVRVCDRGVLRPLNPLTYWAGEATSHLAPVFGNELLNVSWYLYPIVRHNKGERRADPWLILWLYLEIRLLNYSKHKIKVPSLGVCALSEVTFCFVLTRHFFFCRKVYKEERFYLFVGSFLAWGVENVAFHAIYFPVRLL